MYTGTLIKDLMAMVERAEQGRDEQRMTRRNCSGFLTMQVPVAQGIRLSWGRHKWQQQRQ
jgi:hypothetical protein